MKGGRRELAPKCPRSPKEPRILRNSKAKSVHQEIQCEWKEIDLCHKQDISRLVLNKPADNRH
jgi:hypothetical protein